MNKESTRACPVERQNIIGSLEEITKIDNGKNNIVIYHWDPELELENEGTKLINIFRN
jgi:hypothetical protein